MADGDKHQPHLQEGESVTGPVEELIEIQVDSKEPNHVVKLSKRLKKELTQ